METQEEGAILAGVCETRMLSIELSPDKPKSPPSLSEGLIENSNRHLKDNFFTPTCKPAKLLLRVPAQQNQRSKTCTVT